MRLSPTWYLKKRIRSVYSEDQMRMTLETLMPLEELHLCLLLLELLRHMNQQDRHQWQEPECAMERMRRYSKLWRLGRRPTWGGRDEENGMGVGGRKADECQVLGGFGLYTAPTWNSCKGSQPSQCGRLNTWIPEVSQPRTPTFSLTETVKINTSGEKSNYAFVLIQVISWKNLRRSILQ